MSVTRRAFLAAVSATAALAVTAASAKRPPRRAVTGYGVGYTRGYSG